MKRRHHTVRPLDEARGDLSPYELIIENGRQVRRYVPTETCITVDEVFYLAVDWLPPHLLPVVDSNQWCRAALDFYRHNVRNNRRLGACERYIPRRPI